MGVNLNGENKKWAGWLIWMCAVCYFVSYITRINYGAVLVEIVRTEGISKVEASMALTGSFITYGAGQLVSGWMGDRMKPEKLIFSGLLISTAMNVLVQAFTRPELLLLFWCVNGFAQALMWPPMVKIMSTYLDDEQYKKGCVRVTWGSSAGTILVYLLAPVCIMWKGWRSVFLLCAGIALCFAFVWIRGIAAIERRMERPDPAGSGAERIPARSAGAIREKGEKLFTGRVCFLLGIIMLAIVMQGILRDGITTWTPSYLSETFGLDSSLSILSGVMLPLFSIFCLEITSVLNRKAIRNEMLCAGAVFFAGACGALLLAVMPSFRMQVSIFLAALVTGCMYGVNVILVSMIPPYFKRGGHVSTVSGLLNSCTYVGSALSSYGIAWVVQQRGWNFVIWLWAAAALTGTALCLAGVRPWRRFGRERMS